jgi:hypothetical protein
MPYNANCSSHRQCRALRLFVHVHALFILLGMVRTPPAVPIAVISHVMLRARTGRGLHAIVTIQARSSVQLFDSPFRLIRSGLTYG